MRRPRQHVLEDESRLALKALLPSEWIASDVHPDYGIDMQITIVDGGTVTNRVFSAQIKATDSPYDSDQSVSLPFETKHLSYYEHYPLPVLIFFYIKPINIFYYIFAQRYIKEQLSHDLPNWRKQKTVAIRFTAECILRTGYELKPIVIESAMYVTLSQLNYGVESALYWLDGIPKSDDQELKLLTLEAIELSNSQKFKPAIDAFERVLKLCTVSPSARMAILVNMGNAYLSLSCPDDALANYVAAEQLLTKVNLDDVREGKASIYSGMGMVHSVRSQYHEALSYHRKALKLFRETSHKEGEAATLNNIGNTFREKGELTKALYNFRLALKIHKQANSLKGQGIVLGNVGNVFNQKGNIRKALEYYRSALKIHRQVGDRIAESNMLGSIGTIYGMKHEPAKAVSYLRRALSIFVSIGELESQATTLNNLANVLYTDEHFSQAMKYAQSSLDINKRINNRHGQALNLATIGSILGSVGNIRGALQNCQDAEQILIEIGEMTNLPLLQRQISGLKLALSFIKIH